MHKLADDAGCGRPDDSQSGIHSVTAVARRPVVLVCIVIALAMFAAFVSLLNEVVASGERTRESWRTTELEKVFARALARDQRPAPKP